MISFPGEQMTESTNDVIIPPDIFADEILARLPATNLQSSLKLVCKDWLNLISRPGFTRRQLLLGSNRSVRILVSQSDGIINIDYKKHGCVVGSKEKEVLIPFPPKINGGGHGTVTPRILGSCDGLILLANYYPKRESFFVVFNPSTRKSELFALPNQLLFKLDIYSTWFGRHPTTGEYVFVLCQRNSESSYPKIGLHKFSQDNKLRAVQSCSVHHPSDVLIRSFRSKQERGILLDGVVHWPAHWGLYHTISGYHIEDNKYFELSPPSQTDFKLGVMDGCLLSINKRKEDGVFEVWVMKETRVWTKYSNIEGECNTKFEILSPLSFFPNGDLIMEGDIRILTRYDFNRNKATFLNRYHPPTCVDRLISKAIVCADSMVSPAIVKEEAKL